VCSDSGARSAVFGTSGIGLAVGTAEEVNCNEWSGTVQRSDKPTVPSANGPSGSSSAAGLLSSAGAISNHLSREKVLLAVGTLLAFCFMAM